MYETLGFTIRYRLNKKEYKLEDMIATIKLIIRWIQDKDQTFGYILYDLNYYKYTDEELKDIVTGIYKVDYENYFIIDISINIIYKENMYFKIMKDTIRICSKIIDPTEFKHTRKEIKFT